MAEAAGDECLLAAAFAAPVAVAGLSTGRLTTCGTVIAAATITAAAPAVMASRRYLRRRARRLIRPNVPGGGGSGSIRPSSQESRSSRRSAIAVPQRAAQLGARGEQVGLDRALGPARACAATSRQREPGVVMRAGTAGRSRSGSDWMSARASASCDRVGPPASPWPRRAVTAAHARGAPARPGASGRGPGWWRSCTGSSAGCPAIVHRASGRANASAAISCAASSSSTRRRTQPGEPGVGTSLNSSSAAAPVGGASEAVATGSSPRVAAPGCARHHGRRIMSGPVGALPVTAGVERRQWTEIAPVVPHLLGPGASPWRPGHLLTGTGAVPRPGLVTGDGCSPARSRGYRLLSGRPPLRAGGSTEDSRTSYYLPLGAVHVRGAAMADSG